MKTAKFLVGAALLAGVALSSCQQGTSKAKMVTEIDTVSYALGLSAGSGYAQNLKDFPGGMEVNKEILIKGFMQGLKEDTANYQIKQDELFPLLQAFFTKMTEKDKNEATLKNTQLLFENSQKEGVKVTESGLQYRILKEGNGAIPTKEDVVKVHYTGKLADGTVFDSSVERGEPAEFPVGAVIPGWTEALTMMPVGSEWEIVIPSELGYGENPVGNIPANSILFFDVQLLDIVKK
jgi:FKBP-type peptidyl-prolyl cis-trans isomerase